MLPCTQCIKCEQCLFFTVMMIGYFVLMYTRTAMHYYLCVQSSVTLHAKMLASVLKAKIRFFDTNPIGEF